jgi:hypothetical protein
MDEKEDYYHIVSIVDCEATIKLNQSKNTLEGWLQEIEPQQIDYTFFAFKSKTKVEKLKFKTTFQVEY